MKDDPDKLKVTVEVLETTPLVEGQSAEHTHPQPGTSRSITSDGKDIFPPKVQSRNINVVNFLCVAMFFGACSHGLFLIPSTRVIEDNLCRQYYNQQDGITADSIDEILCKADSVQSKLAFVLAVRDSLQAGAGVIASFPWGIAADRLGRKPVIALGVAGIALSQLWFMFIAWFPTVFPIEWLWFGSSFLLVGGGDPVLGAVCYTMIADVTTESTRAVAFMRLIVAAQTASFASPALASAMMENKGPWLCLLVSCSILAFLGIAALLFLPEAGARKKKTPDEHETGFKSALQTGIKSLWESASMFKNRSLIFLLLTFIGIVPAIHSTGTFMTQFISRRYGIKLAKTGYIQSAHSCATIIMCLVILPSFSEVLMGSSVPQFLRPSNENRRDVLLTQWSFAFLAAGAIINAFSSVLSSFLVGLFMFGLGSGKSSLIRSLCCLYVDAEHRSQLHTFMGIVEFLIAFLSHPALAFLFSLGLRLGPRWIGLPYYSVAAVCCLAGLLLMFVHLPETKAKGARARS